MTSDTNATGSFPCAAPYVTGKAYPKAETEE
jgi:hypothetical protein